MNQITFNDFTIAYNELGSGSPLLFIHGYPLDNSLWQPQMEGLSGHAHLLAPNLRGHGGSSSPSWKAPESLPHTMELFAQDCGSLLDALGITTPVVLCGLSMGGYVSLAFQRMYPQRLAGLVLVATRAGADSIEGKAGREKAAQLARQAGTSAVVEGMLPRMFAPATYTTQPAVVQHTKQMMLATPVETVIADLLGMRDRPDSTPGLANIDCPTLVIHGSEDQIIPASEAETVAAAIPGARFRLLAGAGHLLNLEQPGEFNLALIEFIQSIQS